MNDDKEIDIFKDNEERKEMNNLKLNGNDNKKKIIIAIITIVVCVLLAVLTYFIFIKKDNNKQEGNNTNVNEPTNISNSGNVDNSKKIYYVSCDDNTAYLNVRSSTIGNIIDGLSCYTEVNVTEEEEKTESCPKWYKVSYKKHDSNYTGYVCSSYINELKISEDEYEKIKETVKNALDYKVNKLLPYCGNATDVMDVTFTMDNGSTMKVEYLKSPYKTLEELKTYLQSFLSDNLIDDIKLSDYNNKKYYDDYYEIDGNLYCRNYSNKGVDSKYTGNYNIEVLSNSDKIKLNISYEYLTNDSTCDIKKLDKCSNSNFKYEIGKIEMDKNGNDYKITKMDFPK